MKLIITVIFCVTWQLAFTQAVDNYARNSKLLQDENTRFEDELKTNKDKAEVYWRHANALAAFTFNAYKTAGQFYEKAISIDQSKVVYYIDYINYLHLKLEDDERARQVYRKAVKLFPENQDLKNGIDNLSNSQTNLDSLKTREKFKETSMYYTPNSPIAQIMYVAGETEFKSGNYKKSVSCYLKALELEPDFIDAMDNLGNSYRYLNKFNSAEYWYKKSIQLYPHGFIAHQNLAIVYLSTDRFGDALNEYEVLVRIDPKSPEGYFGKANTNIYLKNGKEVVVHAQKARQLYQINNDEYERDAVYLIGVGYYLQRDNESARKYLLEAQEMGVEIPNQLMGILK
jgi:tetratricopeptide (TPR) repeat protein